MSSFWQNFHHWLHRKLSQWQLSVQSVMKISSKWQHFRFSVDQTASGNEKSPIWPKPLSKPVMTYALWNDSRTGMDKIVEDIPMVSWINIFSVKHNFIMTNRLKPQRVNYAVLNFIEPNYDGSPLKPGAHFTKQFSTIIQISLKNPFCSHPNYNKRPVGLYSPLIVGIVTDFVWSPSMVNTYHHYLIRKNPINWFGQ